MNQVHDPTPAAAAEPTTARPRPVTGAAAVDPIRWRPNPSDARYWR